MAQQPITDYPIDPVVTSGTQLADILNRTNQVLNSGNSGTSRPTMITTGGLWVKTGGTELELYMFDGTTDILISGPSGTLVGDAPPAADPTTLWFDSDAGRMYLKYVNPDAREVWVEANVSGAASPDVTQFVQKTGDTMTGPLTVPKLDVNGELKTTDTAFIGGSVVVGTDDKGPQILTNASPIYAGGLVGGAGQFSTTKDRFVIWRNSDNELTIRSIAANQSVADWILDAGRNCYSTGVGWFRGAAKSGNFISFNWASPNVTASIDEVIDVVIGTASDYRLKTNVAPLESSLEKIDALKPVTYDLSSAKMNTGKSYSYKQIGFLAHEVAEIYPQFVVGDKDALNDEGDPKYQSVNYAGLTTVLVKAIQEQQALITQLQSDVAALKAAS
jgi:hypothetical protein